MLCLALLAFVAGCGGSRLSKSEQVEFAKLPEKSLAERALGYFNSTDYRTAIEVYALILAKEKPEKKYAAWARYEIGYCYYYLEDFAQAKIEFERVLKDYPQEEFAGQRKLATLLLEKIRTGRTQSI